jgi:hypothetical protein
MMMTYLDSRSRQFAGQVDQLTFRDILWAWLGEYVFMLGVRKKEVTISLTAGVEGATNGMHSRGPKKTLAKVEFCTPYLDGCSAEEPSLPAPPVTFDSAQHSA